MGVRVVRFDDTAAFAQWMEQVRAITFANHAIEIDDLPDMAFRDSFDAGVSALDFVANEVVTALGDEFGYGYDDDQDDQDYDDEEDYD